jgi:hypothetical protein
MKFVNFLGEFSRAEIESLRAELKHRDFTDLEKKINQKLLDEKINLFSKFIGYFYRALSDNQKVRYRGTLQAILKDQLELDIELEKAHRGISPEEKEEMKKNWASMLKDAKHEIEEDPEAEYIFFKRKHPWSPLEEKRITKDNLNEYMKWYRNTYNEELGAEG